MLLLPGFRTKHKKINFQSPIHNIFIYWIIYGSNRGVFHSTTQVLEVLQVDFWKGKLHQSLCGASCSAGKQHRWAPTPALACRTDRHLSGAALRWFLPSEKLLQHIWLLCGVRDTDCAAGKCAEKLGGSWVLSMPTSSCGLQAAFPLCQRALFSPWFWLGKKRCSSNWVGFICPKNTAVSPS